MSLEELLEACGYTPSKRFVEGRTHNVKKLQELKEYLEVADLCNKTREIVDTLDNLSSKNPDYINYLTYLREYKDILLVIQKLNRGDLNDEALESVKPDLELLNLKYNYF